jgi:hypothetical protein
LLSTLGGIVQVPLGPFMTRLSTFKLYVDGAQVASKDLNYVVPIGLSPGAVALSYAIAHGNPYATIRQKENVIVA